MRLRPRPVAVTSRSVDAKVEEAIRANATIDALLAQTQEIIRAARRVVRKEREGQ
jgi:hypothetical protein